MHVMYSVPKKRQLARGNGMLLDRKLEDSESCVLGVKDDVTR
jgi:hypothetical protein